MYRPTIIYVDRQVKDLPHTQRVLSYFSDVMIEPIDDVKWLKTSTDFADAKSTWLLTRHRGQVMKTCPAMQPGLKCCNYTIIDFVSNCPMDCSYCILQSYLKNNPLITIYTNVEEIIAQVALKLSQKPNVSYRVGTGELSDSLALDHITGVSEKLVPFFGIQPNATLELKTKTNNVAHLLNLNHNQHTVISWSVNPTFIVESEEHYTASLSERLAAAQQCADAGYPVGFHIDPIIHHDGWEKNYAEMVDQIFAAVPGTQMAWISLGTLRFPDDLREIAMRRFPKSPIFYGEQVMVDGTLRYFKPIRKELYLTIKNFIRRRSASVPIYICMDTKEITQAVLESDKVDFGGNSPEHLAIPLPAAPYRAA